jgi:hypothetical protein
MNGRADPAESPLCIAFLRAAPRSDAIAERHAAVGFAGAALRCRLGIAVHHLAGPPAGKSHQVALIPAGRQPGVGEGVAELVRMQPRQAGRSPRAATTWYNAEGRHGASLTQPAVRMGERVARPQTQVPVQARADLRPKGTARGRRPLPRTTTTWSSRSRPPGSMIPAASETRMPVSRNSRRMAASRPVGEVTALTGFQPAQLVIGQHRRRLVGESAAGSCRPLGWCPAGPRPPPT